MTDTTADSHDAEPGATRRDFLSLTATAMGVVGIGAVAWPFIDQMNPAADTIAAGAPIDVDVSKVEAGQQILVRWRSRPIFIVNRTEKEVQGLKAKSLLDRLNDPDSQSHQQPEYAANWHRSIKPEFSILVGICTHLGCIPEFRPQVGDAELGTDWPGGYFCPCHGSKYDLAGRVYQGVPAPLNLPVPPYNFVKDKIVRIGENPKGSTFQFSSIEQI